MLPLFAVCAGLGWLFAWTPSTLDKGTEELPPQEPTRPTGESGPLPNEEDPPLPEGLIVREIHTDPEAVIATLSSPELAPVSTWVNQLSRGELTPLQVASNLILNLNDRSVQAVAPDTLRRVLPGTVPGWVAGKAKAAYSGGFLMKTSAAEQTFRTNEGKTVQVKIMDTGSMKAVAAFAQELAGTADVEQANPVGLVRTRVFKGHPLFEKYAESRGKASAHLFVHNRFILQVEGRSIALADLEPALEGLRLEELPGPMAAPTP